MSLAELKEQALALEKEEQAELVSFLAERLRNDDPAYRQELARRIDDREATNWVKWSDLKQQFDRGS